MIPTTSHAVCQIWFKMLFQVGVHGNFSVYFVKIPMQFHYVDDSMSKIFQDGLCFFDESCIFIGKSKMFGKKLCHLNHSNRFIQDEAPKVTHQFEGGASSKSDGPKST